VSSGGFGRSYPLTSGSNPEVAYLVGSCRRKSNSNEKAGSGNAKSCQRDLWTGRIHLGALGDIIFGAGITAEISYLKVAEM